MTLEKQVYDGDRAREVLENEQFEQAFADIEQELIEAWKTSPARDEAGRQELFRLLKSLEKVKSALHTRLETGKLAKLQLQNEQTMLHAAKLKVVQGWSSIWSDNG